METSAEGISGLPGPTDSAAENDFGKFLIDFASLLTLEIVLQLATHFNCPPSQYDQLERSPYPGKDLIKYLREKKIVNSTNISSLIEALRFLELHGVAQKVDSSFRKHILGIQNRLYHDILAKSNRFCQELKTQYELWYFSVRPVPFELTFRKNVNDVFINSAIEVMDETKREDQQGRWTKIQSYLKILTMFPTAKRIFIQGEPGYGKTLLLQKLVYDWVTAKKTDGEPVKIFILLRLKDLKGVKSIYDAIRTLLPQDSDITCKDVMDILKSDKVSTLFAFDGYDEYSDSNEEEFDIPKIIEGKMFASCQVLTTTRPSILHNLHGCESKMFRLAGFDRNIQRQYLEKVLESGKASTDQTMLRLRENAILADMCEVPLFFAFFTHIIKNKTDNHVFESVTSFFSHLIACFFSHLVNKDMKARNETVTESSDGRIKLGQLAYEGLSCGKQKLLWDEDEILQRIDPDTYNQYIKVGMLLKERKLSFTTVPGSHAQDLLQYQTKVQFFHKTLQEYYAALFLTHQIQAKNIKNLQETLNTLDVNSVSYLFRFLCGLDSILAKEVIKHLRGVSKPGEEFIVLCVAEQGGDGLDDTIEELCFRQVTFLLSDTSLLRRSKLQLLQMASSRKIPIKMVCLVQCLNAVNVKEEALEFSSCLLPKLPSLEGLEIADQRDLKDMAKDILWYASRCGAVQKVEFFASNLRGNILILPWQFRNEEVLDALRRQQCKVTWDDAGYRSGHDSLLEWSLDLRRGQWRRDHNFGRPVSKEEYDQRCSTVTMHEIEGINLWRNHAFAKISRTDEGFSFSISF